MNHGVFNPSLLHDCNLQLIFTACRVRRVYTSSPVLTGTDTEVVSLAGWSV